MLIPSGLFTAGDAPSWFQLNPAADQHFAVFYAETSRVKDEVRRWEGGAPSTRPVPAVARESGLLLVLVLGPVVRFRAQICI